MVTTVAMELGPNLVIIEDTRVMDSVVLTRKTKVKRPAHSPLSWPFWRNEDFVECFWMITRITMMLMLEESLGGLLVLCQKKNAFTLHE